MIHLQLPDGTVKNFDRKDTRKIYDNIAGFLNPKYTSRSTGTLTEEQHLIAADAEGWCELAANDESYQTSRLPGLTITISE